MINAMSNSEVQQNTPQNIDWEGVNWRDREFSYPNRTIRVGTSFSGIGAIEHAFQQLGLKTELLFAGDIDKNCQKAYLANYALKPEQWHTDIHTFDKTLYPREPKGNYYCYVFDDEISIGKMDIEGLSEYGKQKMEAECEYVEGMPMFVLGSEIMKFRKKIL